MAKGPWPCSSKERVNLWMLAVNFCSCFQSKQNGGVIYSAGSHSAESSFETVSSKDELCVC